MSAETYTPTAIERDIVSLLRHIANEVVPAKNQACELGGALGEYGQIFLIKGMVQALDGGGRWPYEKGAVDTEYTIRFDFIAQELRKYIHEYHFLSPYSREWRTAKIKRVAEQCADSVAEYGLRNACPFASKLNPLTT